MAQFVLVNVVVAVLMKHLEESHRQLEDDELDELERILEGEITYGMNPLCMDFGSILKIPSESFVNPIKKVNSLPECLPSESSTKKQKNNLKPIKTDQFCTFTSNDSITNTKTKSHLNNEQCNVCFNNNNLKPNNMIKNKMKICNEHNEETESSLLLPQQKVFGIKNS